MIRKSGWLIFIVLCAVMFALVYLLAGFALRIGATAVLEKAVGAEVNIDNVSVSLAPLAVTVTELQITDKNQPSHNSVSFARASASLELWPALLGYHVIDELTVDGFVYGAQRTAPGRVYRGINANAEEPLDLAAVINVDLPSAEELIARANLQTGVRGEALQQQAIAQQKQLAELAKQLPNKDTLADIEAQIKALQANKIENTADLADKTKQLEALQETLKVEREKLQKIQQQLAASRAQLQQSVTELRQANEADWRRLQQLANLDGGGLAPLSQLLLGDVWGKRIAQLESIYRLVKPYIPAAKDTAEGESESPLATRILPLPHQPYPNFWVKKARVNWLIGGGQATISLTDITTQHGLIDAATRFNLAVERLPEMVNFKLDGDFKIMQQMIAHATWQLDGYSLEALAIGKGDNALTLSSGLLDSSGSLSLLNDQITQEARMLLQKPDFSSAGNAYLQQLVALLAQQETIPITFSANGELSHPEVKIRSTLDKVIGDALLGEAKAKVAKLQTQLRGQLDSQLQQQLGKQNEWLSVLDKQDGEAAALQTRIDELLKAKLNAVKDNAKAKVKERFLKPLENK